MKKVLSDSADEILVKKMKEKNGPWMTDKSLEKMDKRRNYKRNEINYINCHKDIFKMCTNAKETRQYQQCEEAK